MHRNHLWISVRNFDTNRSFSWYRGNDTNTGGGKAQHNIIFQVPDFRNTNAGFWHNFVQSNRWSNRCLDSIYFNTKVLEDSDDFVFIRILFHHVDLRIVVGAVNLQQIEGRRDVMR